MNNKLSNKFIIKSNFFIFLIMAIASLFLKENINVVRYLFYIFCFNIFIEIILNKKYKYKEEIFSEILLTLLPCHIIFNIIFLLISHMFDKYVIIKTIIMFLLMIFPTIIYILIIQKANDSTQYND